MSKSKEISLDILINEKLEENLKDIQKYRNIMINIRHPEQFNLERNKIIQGLFNIEDDIRETYQLAKSTLMINKDINEQIEEEIEKNKELTMKNDTLEKTLDELQMDLQSLIDQVEYYKDRDADNVNYIKELERRLLKVNNKHVEDKNEITENLKKCEIQEAEKSNLNSEIFENKNSKNEAAELDRNEIQLHNDLNKILSERVNEKRILNEYFNNPTHIATNINKDNPIDELPVKENQLNIEVYNSNNETNDGSGQPNTMKPVEKKEEKSRQNKTKANRVVDIIMKLNTCDDTCSIIKRLFGDDVEQRLSSCAVEEEFLSKIEESIKEIEELKSKELEMQSPNVNENNKNNTSDHYEFNDYTDNNNENKGPGWNPNTLIDPKQKNEQQNYHEKYNYDSLINYIPNKKSNYNSEQTITPLINKELSKKSLMKDTQSNSRRFTPPKKYEYYEQNQSHSNICRSKSKRKNLNKNTNSVYSNISNLNKIIAGKILNSTGQDEYNFENSLRNYLKKGIKKSGGNHQIFKNHTTPYGNFFDPSLQKGGISNYVGGGNRNKSNSKSKPKSILRNKTFSGIELD